MRTIKFRGKTKMSLEELNDIHVEHEDGWFYGHLVMYGNTPYIVGDFIEVDQDYTINEFWVPVYPESVGQYTGLKDKNGKGKEIYKGDIIEFNNCDYMRTAGHLADEIERGIIVFEDGAFWVNDRLLIDVLTNDEEAKVIGNIFEHPHLIGGKHG